MGDQPSLLQLADELRNMTWYRVHGHLDRLSLSVHTFEGNFRELAAVGTALCDPRRSAPFTRLRHHDVLGLLLCEFIRHLHNYVAAAMSLVVHSRRISRRIAEEGHPVEGYQDRVDSEFRYNARHQIIQGLRNYYLHYEMPDVDMTVSIDGGELRIKQVLELRVEDLLRSDRWKPEAEAYLKSVGEKLDVMGVITTYRHQVRGFYQWFESQVNAAYCDEIQAYRRKEAELLLLQLKDFLSMAVADGTAGTSEGEEIAFHTMLKTPEFAALESLPPRSKSRADKALQLLRGHVPVSRELEQTIRDWYSSGSAEPGHSSE
jgi:hypothetical protein